MYDTLIISTRCTNIAYLPHFEQPPSNRRPAINNQPKDTTQCELETKIVGALMILGISAHLARRYTMTDANTVFPTKYNKPPVLNSPDHSNMARNSSTKLRTLVLAFKFISKNFPNSLTGN